MATGTLKRAAFELGPDSAGIHLTYAEFDRASYALGLNQANPPAIESG